MRAEKIYFAAAALGLWLIFLPVAADAQTGARVRGTVIAFDGKVLVVKSVDGKDLELQLAANTAVVYPRAITLAELGPSAYVGVTATRDSKGRLVAREMHTLSPTATAGHRPMAQDPGATMTNANIARTVKSANGDELTLEYQGGSQTIVVPEGTPIVTTVAADRSLLVPGAYVVITAAVAADGAMTAERIQASKDGVKPRP